MEKPPEFVAQHNQPIQCQPIKLLNSNYITTTNLIFTYFAADRKVIFASHYSLHKSTFINSCQPCN